PLDRDYTVHSTLKNIKDVQNMSESIAQDIGLEKIEQGNEYVYPIEYHNRLLALSAQSVVSHFNESLGFILIFIIALIVIATVAVIYNAFNISVLDRISQFGVLRSVGASPKQIRGM